MSKNFRVGIIGGGIGGLALSATLARRGIESRIFERAHELAEVGAGIQVTPNAAKALAELGLATELDRIGFLPNCIVGRNYKTGREAFRTPLKGACLDLYGANFFHVHRADLHRMLLSQVPQNAISLNAQVTSVRNESDKAVATLASGEEFEADLIVGADGIRSVVRDCLFGETPAKYTGHMCWRAVVPVAHFPMPGVTPDSSMWLGPHGHIVTYYVKGGAAVNIVAVVESPNWVEESWTAESSPAELAEAFKGWHPNVVELLGKTDRVFKWGLFDRDPMQTWSKGRVTLLGDAAHPMLPFLSQGAAMSIEDGYVLGTAIDHHRNDLDAALYAYEAERRPRTARVQLESRERGRTYHLPTRWSQMQRDLRYFWKNMFDPQSSGMQANWVYEYSAADFERKIAGAPHLSSLSPENV